MSGRHSARRSAESRVFAASRAGAESRGRTVVAASFHHSLDHGDELPPPSAWALLPLHAKAIGAAGLICFPKIACA
ncbi:hypothetical protein ACQKOH_09445 [Sphingomonas sp. NPDC092331]|jgi:hypothetical protein|uniref:hypothetical protein n=1 Tax=unclassified Sphingomonas TaxID=196159 RepID=UPI0031F4EDA0